MRPGSWLTIEVLLNTLSLYNFSIFPDSVSSDIASDSSKSLTSSKQRLDFSPPNSMHRNLSDGPPFTGMPRSSGGSLTSSRVLFGKKHSSESTPAGNHPANPAVHIFP